MLYRCAVMVLQDRGVSRSCGMHAFGLPDAQVEAPPSEANPLLGSLNVYQLAEDPVLVSGDTFRPDLDTPRRRLERWPDDGYPPGHACHNPFGTWRVGTGGDEADSRSELRPVFIPALVSLRRAWPASTRERWVRPRTARSGGRPLVVGCGHSCAHRTQRITRRVW